MANEQQTIDHGVDGGAPTDEEARLAAQVDTIGDNPDKEPDAAPADGEGGEGAAKPDAGPDAAAAPAEGDAAAAAAPAPAPAPAPATEEPAAAPAPPPPPPAVALPPKPEPPKDFAAELQNLQDKYDSGDLEPSDFQEQQRALIREEAKFEARLGVWEDRVRELAHTAEQDFANTALAWERQNASFMENPLRAKQMQEAIAIVDQQHPGLPAAQLFEKAEKIAFEAYNWAKPAAAADAQAVDPAAAIAAATAARQPAQVPQTLASAPAAAAIDQRSNAAYADLDGKDISSLEDALARMTSAQQEAYLSDAPGANTRGLPD